MFNIKCTVIFVSSFTHTHAHTAAPTNGRARQTSVLTMNRRKDMGENKEKRVKENEEIK